MHRSTPRFASAAAALLLAAACGGTSVTTGGESGAPAATPSASAHRSADALERWAPAGSAVTVSADAAERRLADAGDRGCRSLTSADAIERCLASP